MRTLALLIPLLLLVACDSDDQGKPGKLTIKADVDTAVIEGNSIMWEARTNFGANAHHVWSIESGSLPSGFTMTPADNTLTVSGSSNVPGDYPVTLRVEVDDRHDSHAVMFRVAPLTGPLAIYTTVVPDSFDTATYSHDIVITGGTNTGYSFSIIAGSLPQNYSITAGPSGARLSGVASPHGTYTFTLEVTDSGANVASAAFSFTLKENISGPA